VRGLSVTNPFKSDVAKLLDHVDPLAERAGAVNTVVADGDRLLGHNTDVGGAMAPRELASRFGCEASPLEELAPGRADVLVNTTPVGTRGPQEGESPVPAGALAGVRLVYDLVYNPGETRLLAEARAAGCATLNGLPMLVEQAALQFELWTGRPAPRARMVEGVKGDG
jgi:shikimate 5-dehydrogenase